MEAHRCADVSAQHLLLSLSKYQKNSPKDSWTSGLQKTTKGQKWMTSFSDMVFEADSLATFMAEPATIPF